MGLLWQTVDSYSAGRSARRAATWASCVTTSGSSNHLAVGFVVSAIDVMLAIRAGQFERGRSPGP